MGDIFAGTVDGKGAGEWGPAGMSIAVGPARLTASRVSKEQVEPMIIRSTCTCKYPSRLGALAALCLATALGAPLVGCSGAAEDAIDDGPLSESHEPLWIANGITKWTTVSSHVPVCFESSVPSGLRTTVHTALANSWMRVAQLDFTNFGSCPASFNGGVRVSINTGLGSGILGNTSTFGYPGSGSSTTVEFSSTSPSTKTIVHEFGHVLGFLHEHADDGSCNQRTGGGTQLSGNDEPASVMSQSKCNSAGQLSPRDIVGVQVAYGPRGAGSLVGVNSQCLQVPFAAPSGSTASYVPCNGSSMQQQWRRDSSYHLFASGSSTGFLDIRGGAITSGATVQVFSQNSPPTANQQWLMNSVQVLGMGNLCVDVPSGNFANGTVLQMFQCNGGNNQSWKVTPNANSTLTISNGNFCWDVPNGSATSGNPIQLFSCNGGTNQQFTPTSAGALTFGGLCADVAGGQPNNGSSLQLFGCKGSSDPARFNQRFHLNGQIVVGNNSGQCLDVPGGTLNTASAQIFTCNGGANQNWDFYWGL